MSTLDPRALRQAFSSFLTGVTVVTSKTATGVPVGFTANSFSSVSLDPPLLLVCPGKFLSTYDAFADCTRFAVNILAEGQEDVANTFASYKGDRFARVAHREDAHGNMLIDGAIASFSCTTDRVIPAGDHAILLGQVQAFDQTEGRGLGYAGGQFFSLGLERAALEPKGATAICGALIRQGETVMLEPTPDGYRLPQVNLGSRGVMRQTLTRALADQGLTVQLGPAYSVFDDGGAHCSYLLATSDSPCAAPFEQHPISTLHSLPFASAAIAEMMKRFAKEAQTQSFGLYVGDAQSGDLHHQFERT